MANPYPPTPHQQKGWRLLLLRSRWATADGEVAADDDVAMADAEEAAAQPVAAALDAAAQAGGAGYASELAGLMEELEQQLG